VAQRVNAPDVLHGRKRMWKASGTKGVAQGGVLSPLLRNRYRTAVDRMRERAKEVTRRGAYTYLDYARFADDLVSLVDAYPQHDWLLKAVETRLREELATLQGAINEDKSRTVDLARGEHLSVLGFACRRGRSRRGAWRAW
jgi:RNA-directed DNA polymerase